MVTPQHGSPTVAPTRLSTWACYRGLTTRSPSGSTTTIGRSATPRRRPAFKIPFMWTEGGGMVNLITQGFPGETPLGISPGGTVATVGHWYRLGDPGSVITLTSSPSGFLLENSTVGINDAGDQARFLVTTRGRRTLFTRSATTTGLGNRSGSQGPAT